MWHVFIPGKSSQHVRMGVYRVEIKGNSILPGKCKSPWRAQGAVLSYAQETDIYWKGSLLLRVGALITLDPKMTQSTLFLVTSHLLRDKVHSSLMKNPLFCYFHHVRNIADQMKILKSLSEQYTHFRSIWPYNPKNEGSLPFTTAPNIH